MGGPFFVVSRVHEIPFTCNTDDDDDGMRHSGKPDLDRSIFTFLVGQLKFENESGQKSHSVKWLLAAAAISCRVL